ncbi:MAG: hypothetical protein MK105_13200 [Crocinitomicaceae bacterium]|nr:hypothetical protein [Crocinitomicaceae bacterium]
MSEFLELNTNKVGSVSYCYNCECFHLKLHGVLSFLSNDQLSTIEFNLNKMKRDLEFSHNLSDPSIGVQIKLTKNTYLCLTYDELVLSLELIDIAIYMKDVNDIVKL